MTRARILLAVLAIAIIFLPSTTVSAEEGWQKLDSRYFILYYKSAPRDFVEAVAQTAEELYYQIPRNIGFMRYEAWKYDNRAKIYIYDEREEYQKFAKDYQWSGGHANIGRKEIRTYPSAAGFFDSTLPHEIAHLIFREFIGNAQVPIWLDEGIAMYQEKAKRWGAHRVVKKAIEDGKFIPLQELTHHRLLREKDDEIINIFYAQAASIVYYMIVELGQSRFENFCRKLRDGIPFEQALYDNYGRFRTLAELNQRWVEYIKLQK